MEKKTYINYFICIFSLSFMCSFLEEAWEMGYNVARNDYLSSLRPDNIILSFLLNVFFKLFIYIPFFMAVIEMAKTILFFKLKKYKDSNKALGLNLFVIGLAFFYLLSYLFLGKEVILEDYDKALYFGQLHSPISLGNCVGIFLIVVLYICAYIRLYLKDINKSAPLSSAIELAILYMGYIFLVVFIYQIWMFSWLEMTIYVLPLPVISLMQLIRLIAMKINDFDVSKQQLGKINRIPILSYFNRLLNRGYKLPIFAFILVLPVLSLIVVVLMVFGQEPDSLIKAFTSTADWNLSREVPPPNIVRPDEHYLCTVAASGHKKIVKPLRYGIRHNHQIVVNRQLLIANAFEQIIEEKTPRFHRLIRGFYDRYGFPIAKVIRSKVTCDAIYLLMKPLEWIFLVVIYLVDERPENRIAVQYLGRSLDEEILLN